MALKCFIKRNTLKNNILILLAAISNGCMLCYENVMKKHTTESNKVAVCQAFHCMLHRTVVFKVLRKNNLQTHSHAQKPT